MLRNLALLLTVIAALTCAPMVVAKSAAPIPVPEEKPLPPPDIIEAPENPAPAPPMPLTASPAPAQPAPTQPTLTQPAANQPVIQSAPAQPATATLTTAAPTQAATANLSPPVPAAQPDTSSEALPVIYPVQSTPSTAAPAASAPVTQPAQQPQVQPQPQAQLQPPQAQPQILAQSQQMPPVAQMAASAPTSATATPDDVASTSYFPVLPFDAAPDADPQLVPIASNHSIEGDHKGIFNAVIAIHDFQRDARGALTLLSTLAGANNGTTIIIAPQFLLDFDLNRFSAKLPDHGRMFARWQLGGWENGGDALAQSPNRPISSFTVVDLLLMYLGDKKFFPDIQQITIAGHGVGGDFVQRYAAAGRAMDILGSQPKGSEGPQIRFLVANASSYIYLTGIRPRPGKPGFVTPDAKTCPGFNDYPYGLDKLNDYARRVGATAMKLSYAARSVTYLIGEKVAVSDPLPDASCGAVMEGANRNIRAMNYNMYLYQTFGEAEARSQKFVTVPKAGYDPAALFGSACGAAVMFGDGICK